MWRSAPKTMRVCPEMPLLGARLAFPCISSRKLPCSSHRRRHVAMAMAACCSARHHRHRCRYVPRCRYIHRAVATAAPTTTASQGSPATAVRCHGQQPCRHHPGATAPSPAAPVPPSTRRPAAQRTSSVRSARPPRPRRPSGRRRWPCRGRARWSSDPM